MGSSTTAQEACPAIDQEIVSTPAPPQAPFWEHYKKIVMQPASVALVGDSHAFYWRQQEWAASFPNASMVNLGVPGDRVQNTLWRLQQPDMQQISPRVALLFIGTNNFSDRTAPCAVATGVGLLIDQMSRNWPGVSILVVRPFLRGAFGTINAEVTQDYWDLLSADMRLPESTILLDLNAAGRCDDISFFRWYRMFSDERPTSPCDRITRDLGHLTPAGYRSLGQALSNVLASLDIPFSEQ